MPLVKPMEGRRDDGSEFDLLTIGAVNIDYVVRQDTPLGAAGEYEDVLPRREAEARLAARHTGDHESEPGGSAFNTARAVAALKSGLRVGFIGALGIQAHGGRLLKTLEDYGMPSDLVLTVPEDRPGACFASLDEHGRRQLLTSPFANECMARWLPQLVEMRGPSLAKTRMLHVTSLFDDALRGQENRSSQAVVHFVAGMKALNPGLIVSFDPGTYWVKHEPEAVRAILKHTDFLFLNSSEMAHLARREGDPPGERLARIIFNEIGRRSIVIVWKEAGEVRCYHSIGDGPAEERIFLADRLPKSDLRNPVGTGDALAAGFLATQLLRVDIAKSVHAGQALARTKLVFPHSEDAEREFTQQFADLKREVLRPVDRRWDVELRLAARRFEAIARELKMHLRSEAEVQRLLLGILRAEWGNIEAEVQSPGVGGSSGRCDFGIPSKGIFVECEFVGEPKRQKEIIRSIDSIARRYSEHQQYRRLFMFICDPGDKLPHPEALLRMQGERGRFEDVCIEIVVTEPPVQKETAQIS